MSSLDRHLPPADRREASRVAWVDAAKGICIVLVVMMYSTLGTETIMGRHGWMGDVVTFAWPFRMPDFFLISGLFLARVIDRPWRRYLDMKVVHFAYFYVLWLTIQFAFRAPEIVAEGGAATLLRDYLVAYAQPFGALWFIYMLPVFFVVTRLLQPVSPWLVLAAAALLEILPVATGSIIVDEFCARFVYFFAGYFLAGRIFAFAQAVAAHPRLAVAALALWAPLNVLMAFTPAPAGLAAFLQMTPMGPAGVRTLAELPLLSLPTATVGVLAVVTVASLIAGARWSRWLVWLGGHSIVVYLAFFLPMAVARVAVIRSGLVDDVGTVALIATVCGVAGPVVLYLVVQATGRGRWLFERPAWARLSQPAPRPSMQAAE